MSESIIIVIGGGVVGLSAALAMHQQGYSVTLLDAGPLHVDALTISPRVYAINPASQRLFQQLGIWNSLDMARLSPYQHMHVWDAATQAHIDFDSRMIAASQLGTIIDEAHLRHALLSAIATTDIALHPESTVVSVKEGPDTIDVCTDQQSWAAALLIIADGASSSTRELLRVPMTQWPYHQHALVATVQTEKPHQQTAYQVFNSDGVLAFLPLVDPHQCSIVWSSRPQLTQHRIKQSDGVFDQQLTDAFEHKLGRTTVLSKRYSFPLQMRHVKQYAGSRWILMGDAAHTIHPLAGLGLNLGLADLASWLSLLNDKTRHLSAKKTLGAYQRQRQHAVWQTIALMEGLKTLFLTPLTPIARIRGLGLNLCNRLTPLKRLFIYCVG